MADRLTRVRATHRHTRATAYRQPGGPWDVPTLDALLRADPPTETDEPQPRAALRHDVLVDGDHRLSAEALDRLAAAAAGGLRQLGVGRRDVVAWQVPNGYESVVLFRACWRLGAVAVPIHHQAKEAEANRALEQIAPRVIVGSPALPLGRHPDAISVRGASLPARRRGTGGTSGASGTPRSSAKDEPDASSAPMRQFAELLAADPVTESPTQPADVAVVLFVPGADDARPGVVHTHRTLASKALDLADAYGLRSSDSVLAPAPFAHIAGLLHGLLVPGVAHAKTVLMPEWNPSVALDLVERERVSLLVGTPRFFDRIMGDPDFRARRVRSLRAVSTGGTEVTPAFVARAGDTLRAGVVRSYGSTEAPMIVISSIDDEEARPRGATEVRVVDPVSGTDQDRGKEGELWVRGPELFAGYLDEAATRAAFARGGWFRTGELAVLDAAGQLTTRGPMTISG